MKMLVKPSNLPNMKMWIDTEHRHRKKMLIITLLSAGDIVI